MSLPVSIKDCSAAEGATVIQTCVHGCIVIGCAKRQGKHLRFPEPYAILSSRRPSLRSDMTCGSAVSVPTGRKRIDVIFRLVVKMPRIHQAIYGLRNNRFTAKISIIRRHVRASRCPIRTCRDISPSTRTASTVKVLSGRALTGLT